MNQSQFSLAWDSFKSNICSGFSTLQQNGEFVDMTLAADGHLVKVHQVLVALASPYLKDMIVSAPCPHPVIYLNNISHKVLCYLLEYIYTGEVIVPCEHLMAFGEAAKSLHVKGLESISGGTNNYSESLTKKPSAPTPTISTPTPKSTPIVENNPFTHGTKRKANTSDQVGLPPAARKIFIKAEGPIAVQPSLQHIESTDDSQDFSTMNDTAQDSDDGFRHDVSNMSLDVEKLKSTASSLLFTVSIRGSLQVILNRYIYNLNSSTLKAGGQRRWRCVDYRNNKCSAFVITKGNVVVNRSNVHCHPFHDKKILSKLQKKAVFSAIDDVEAYNEKEKEMIEEGRIEDVMEYKIDD